MQNKKSVAVIIIALILVIGVLFVVWDNQLEKSLLLSPSENEEIDEKIAQGVLDTFQTNLIDEINKLESDDSLVAQNQEKLNNLLSTSAGKDSEAMVRRFIQDPDSFPEAVTKPLELDIENYDISITHGERFTEESIEEIDTVFELVNRNQPLGESERLRLNFINDHNYELNFGSVFESDIYRIDDQAYVVIDSPASVESGQESDVRESEVLGSPLTGYQVHSPPVPYNQVNRNFAVIVPYNANFPLPANGVSYINAKFPYISQYFRENSENTATYTFTVYPISVPNNWDLSYNSLPVEDIIGVADPTINYAQHEMAMVFVPTASCCSGYAQIMYNSQGNVDYFNTNEPLIGAAPVVFFDPSNPDINRNTDSTIKHQMGHVLTAFNPNVNWNYFGGFLPHARGFLSGSGTYPCPSNGPIVDCNPHQYGDELDIMGSGKGLFSHHRAVHDLGLRSPSSVQSISSSGTYTLCPSNRGIANCPRELLIQNPNGANLALEILATPLSSTYSAYQNCQDPYYQGIFDSIILRAVDLEQGGGLGNILYRGNGGDVIYPVSSAASTCLGPNGQPLMDFPLHLFQSVNTPVGTITFQSYVNNQATILLNYNVPACATGPPQVSLTQVYQGGGPLQVFQHRLNPINFQRSRALGIRSSNTCTTQDYATIITDVTVGSTTYRGSTQMIPLPQNQDILYQELNLPSELSNLALVPPGIYPMTITVSPLSAPGQVTTITGQLELVTYNPPSIYSVYSTSFCSDLDTTYYPPEYFGTNFQSRYPAIGGVISSASNPLSATYLPDSCIWNNGAFFAGDVVCSNNIPGAIPNYAIIALKDCRLEMNNQNAFCYKGVCY